MTQALQTDDRTIGSLNCTVIDSPGCRDQVTALVVVCHGFGAPGTDLVPCGPEIYHSAGPSINGVRFIFPAAPIELDPYGYYDSRAWWPIDMFKLQEMMQRGELRDLRNDRPQLLDERFEQIRDLVAVAQSETGLDNSKLVLGGFSQGSMLATEAALRFETPPAGLIVWSGTLLSESQWTALAAKRGGLRIFQSHGRSDPILPFAGGELLHQFFVDNGFDAEFIPFQGPHTIGPHGIDKAAEIIQSAVLAKN